MSKDNIVSLVDKAAAATAATVEELNEKYAVVTVGAKVRIMTLQEDPPVFYAQEDFKLLLADRSVTVTDVEGNSRKVGLGAWWLKHPQRRKYRGVVFEPGSPQEVDGCRNTWTGFTVEPKEGCCDRG